MKQNSEINGIHLTGRPCFSVRIEFITESKTGGDPDEEMSSRPFCFSSWKTFPDVVPRWRGVRKHFRVSLQDGEASGNISGCRSKMEKRRETFPGVAPRWRSAGKHFRV